MQELMERWNTRMDGIDGGMKWKMGAMDRGIELKKESLNGRDIVNGQWHLGLQE